MDVFKNRQGPAADEVNIPYIFNIIYTKITQAAKRERKLYS